MESECGCICVDLCPPSRPTGAPRGTDPGRSCPFAPVRRGSPKSLCVTQALPCFLDQTQTLPPQALCPSAPTSPGRTPPSGPPGPRRVGLRPGFLCVPAPAPALPPLRSPSSFFHRRLAPSSRPSSAVSHRGVRVALEPMSPASPRPVWPTPPDASRGCGRGAVPRPVALAC